LGQLLVILVDLGEEPGEGLEPACKRTDQFRGYTIVTLLHRQRRRLINISVPDEEAFIAPREMDWAGAGVEHRENESAFVVRIDVESRDVHKAAKFVLGPDRDEGDRSVRDRNALLG